MPTNKPVWGIDLGQCALRALQLRAVKDQIEILDHVQIEHAKILSQPDADRPALVAETMGKFADQHDLSKAILVVGVPGQHTLARFTKLPPVDKKKIPEIVKYEAQQQIPFDMDEVIWDYQVFEREEGTETEVGIFAMRRDLLREQLHPFSNLNLEPGAVQSSPLALFNALKFDGLCGDEPVCVLDIGAQNTDLIVIVGDSLWTRNIPIGGNNFTEALLKTFKLSFRKAERLKRDAQKHKYARQIFQAMRPAFADLVAEVQRSIGFFTSSRRGVKLRKIIAMGNAFRLPGMVKFVQQNLGLDVVRPAAFNRLPVREAPNAAQLMDQLLSFGVAYGLALQGLELAPITSNLLPPEIAKQVVWHKKTPWFYGAAACLLLSAGIVWGRNLMDQRAVETARQGAERTPSFSLVYAEADTEQKDPLANPDALRIVTNGPSAAKPLARANEVIAAGKHLNELLGQISRRNDDKIAEAQNMAALQGNKLVWPAILHLIHSALPPLDPELAEALAQGPEAYKKLVTELQPDKFERSKRKQLFIEEFKTEYCPDVRAAYQELAASTGGAPSGALADTGGAVVPGFLVTLTVRTPNQGGVTFINQEFVAKLRGAAYESIAYVDQVQSRWRRRVRDSEQRRFGGGVGGSRLGPAQPAQMAGGTGSLNIADAGYADPVTGEAMQNDWMSEIIIAVVPGDKSQQPAVQDTGSEEGF